ncbi:hypothetical protein [Nonomuraea sp. B19D2]|uniref:hypothetical protein n=1 Tax=Nonomuraea sp. B19D2 TaxID=3159561 RepID=UPI0032DB7572
MRIVTGIVVAAMGAALLTGSMAHSASAASDRGGLGSGSGLGPSSEIGMGKGISSAPRGNASRFGS